MNGCILILEQDKILNLLTTIRQKETCLTQPSHTNNMHTGLKFESYFF